MGKDLIAQRRGRGSPRYRSPSFRYAGRISYRPYTAEEREGGITGVISDLIHSPGHTAPLMLITYEDGSEALLPAPKGVRIGQEVTAGVTASTQPAHVAPLRVLPEGTLVYNIEKVPGDGGKFIRSAGSAGRIVAKREDAVVVLLPSKKTKEFHPDARATIGIIAGSGRKEKPFIKAGAKYHYRKARGKKHPRVSGVSMNAVDHPFGGTKSSHKGKPTIAPRNAPPGRKVGKIRPRRTGRRKK